MNNPQLPPMQVEKRDSKTAHRVPEPDLSPENMSAQIQDALQLNNDAKVYEFREELYRHADDKVMGWTEETLEVLRRHISEYYPVDHQEIVDATYEVFGYTGFDQVARWVQDDQCSEVFNVMLKYCLKEGQKHKQERGFIDGSGIGYLNAFTRNLKVNIEKTFDAKYFYKVKRPLAYLWEDMGMNLEKVANAIHPGHWSYGQGHSTKSFTAVQTLEEVFHLDSHCRKNLFIAACLFGHGRDGNLIHYPMDTYASGYNTKLSEFA